MIALWVAFLVLAIAMFFMGRRRPSEKELPGPPAIPILGNVLQILTAFQTYTYPFTHLAKTYGEIYRLKIPFDEIVILASYETIQGVLTRDEATGRDVTGILVDRGFGQNLGIAFANGEIWDKSRKWAFKNLREFGFGKSLMLEVSVKEEIHNFFIELDKNEKKDSFIFHVSQTFLVPVSHIMYKMVAGLDAKIDKETIIEMNRQTALMEKASGLHGTLGGALAVYFPKIRYLFPDWTGRTIQLSCREIFQKESRRLRAAAEKKMSQPGAQPTSLTEKFVSQRSIVSEKDANLFSDLNHDMIFADLFQAASSTTTSYLEATLLYLILYPDVQEKIYQEIQELIPMGQDIRYEDKNRMVYTHAFMLEVHRLANVFPNLLPRRAVADFDYKNFRIKKNTMLIADVNSLYGNPEIFEGPLEFKPERFLESNGNVFNQKLIISFSVGKRSCPGEQFSDVTTFIFFLNLIRKFKLSTVPGEPKPTTDMRTGITNTVNPFSMLMTRRESS